MFKNPYADLPEEDKSRITVDISTADYRFIACMRPSMGTITGLTGLLWQKLCNELKRRNITDVSRADDFEQFVIHVRLVDGRNGLHDRPVRGALPQTDPLNVGTGTEGLCAADAGEQTELPDVEKQRPGKGKKRTKRSEESGLE